MNKIEAFVKRVKVFLNKVKVFLKKRYKQILVGTGITLLGILIIATASFFIIKYNGYKSLNKTAVVEGKTIESTSIDSIVKYKGKQYRYKDGIVNILFLGIDKSSGMSISQNPGGMGQSDCIFLASIDTNNNTMRIIAIPRDTMVPVQLYDANNQYYNMKSMQITLQYANGYNSEKSAELASDAVSNLLLHIPIQRFCALNLNTVSLVNDEVGGVPVTIENDFTDEQVAMVDEAFVKGNTVTLNGAQALKFVQERDCSLFASSMDRLGRQKMYVDSFLETAKKEISKDMMLPIHIYDEIKENDYISTNITGSESVYLASEMLDIPISTDNIVTIPGEVRRGDIYEEYYANSELLEAMVMDTFYEQVN